MSVAVVSQLSFFTLNQNLTKCFCPVSYLTLSLYHNWVWPVHLDLSELGRNTETQQVFLSCTRENILYFHSDALTSLLHRRSSKRGFFKHRLHVLSSVTWMRCWNMTGTLHIRATLRYICCHINTAVYILQGVAGCHDLPPRLRQLYRSCLAYDAFCHKLITAASRCKP